MIIGDLISRDLYIKSRDDGWSRDTSSIKAAALDSSSVPLCRRIVC